MKRMAVVTVGILMSVLPTGALANQAAQGSGAASEGAGASSLAGASGGAGRLEGDFNGDSRADLAISAGGEDVGTAGNAGQVHVLYGSASGLSATAIPDQVWSQDSPNVEEVAEPNDVFGWALAAGNFNGDEFVDLAISASQEDVTRIGTNVGVVHVLYGSPTGLSATAIPDQLWTQNSPDVEETAEAEDFFGWALASGDVNGDGFADLGIGVLEDLTVGVDAGAVNVLYGSPTGLSATAIPDQLWTQDSPNVEETAEANDAFGEALATGDMNGDGFADLAIGAPVEDLSGRTDAGAVNLLYGSAAGLSATAVPDQVWSQDSPNVDDASEAGDGFGSPLASGYLNGDAVADLAIGVVFEGVGGASQAGAVNVLYGSRAGLSATAVADQVWTQDSPNVEGVAESIEGFGSALAIENFNGDGFSDLAIGVIGDRVGVVYQAGAVNVLYGSISGLSATAVPDQLWSQNSANVNDGSEVGDFFGGALAAADFNGDEFADLAIGVPGEDVGRLFPLLDAGAVNVLYGSPTGLSATSVPNQFWTQNSSGVEDAAEAGDNFGGILVAMS